MDARPTDRRRARERPPGDGPGGEAVRVSLQYRPPVPGATRADRRERLSAAFGEIAAAQRAHGLEIEPDSLSVSAQSVEGMVPVRQFEALEADLERCDVRLRVVRRMKLV